MSNTSIEDKAEAGLECEGEPTLSKHLYYSAVFSFNSTLPVKSFWTVRFLMLF